MLVFTHYEICKTVLSALLAQLYFSLSAVRFTHTEHTQLETTQTMSVRIRQHFLQHLLLEERAFWRNGVKWSSSALFGTKSLPAAKSSAKTSGRNS